MSLTIWEVIKYVDAEKIILQPKVRVPTHRLGFRLPNGPGFQATVAVDSSIAQCSRTKSLYLSLALVIHQLAAIAQSFRGQSDEANDHHQREREVNGNKFQVADIDGAVSGSIQIFIQRNGKQRRKRAC